MERILSGRISNATWSDPEHFAEGMPFSLTVTWERAALEVTSFVPPGVQEATVVNTQGFLIKAEIAGGQGALAQLENLSARRVVRRAAQPAFLTQRRWMIVTSNNGEPLVEHGVVVDLVGQPGYGWVEPAPEFDFPETAAPCSGYFWAVRERSMSGGFDYLVGTIGSCAPPGARVPSSPGGLRMST